MTRRPCGLSRQPAPNSGRLALAFRGRSVIERKPLEGFSGHRQHAKLGLLRAQPLHCAELWHEATGASQTLPKTENLGSEAVESAS
jgi:hypothetical protein